MSPSNTPRFPATGSKLRFGLALTLMAVLSGCATIWSDQDKAQLAAISIAKPAVSTDAYQKPDATDSPGLAQSIPIATGGGAIPSLLGSAIDAIVTARQQHKFEETNAQYFAALAKDLTTPPTIELQAAINQRLSGHQFFSSRLSETGGASFVTEIQKYGWQKSPLSKDDDILLRMRIIAKVSLKSPKGGILWTGLIAGVASSAKHAQDIVNDPEFVTAGIKEAAQDLSWQLAGQLDVKLGTAKPIR